MPRRLGVWLAFVAVCAVGLALVRQEIGRLLVAWALSGAALRGLGQLDTRLAGRSSRGAEILRIPLFAAWAFFGLSLLMLSACAALIVSVILLRGSG